MKKIIRFYRKTEYGIVREYIHPDHEADAHIIRKLIGQKNINGVVRELIRDLTGCAVDFQEVIAP